MIARRANPSFVALAALLACAGFWLLRHAEILPRLGDGAENASLDARFRIRGPLRAHDDHVVVVGLDDALRERHPEVLLERSEAAKIFGAISAAGATAIAVDLYYDEPERLVPPAVVAGARSAIVALDAERTASPAARSARSALDAVLEAARGDEKLALAVGSAGNVVLAVFLFDPDGDRPAGRDASEPPALARAAIDEIASVDNAPSRRPPRVSEPVTTSLEPIALAAARAGFANLPFDGFQTVRAVDTTLERGGRFYSPLSLAAVAAASTGGTSFAVGARNANVGPYVIPVDPRGRALLDYYGGEGALPYVSAADVLDHAPSASILRGRIAFVGFTDAARDVVRTPYSDRVHGVELHATIAENAIHGEFLHGVPPWVGIAAMLLLGALAVVALGRRFRAWPGRVVAGIVGLGLGWLALSQAAFSGGIILPTVAPAATVFLVGAAGLVTLYLGEREEKAFLRSTFSQYLSPALVDRLVEDPARVRLGGERRELTVLFSDIRGFSRFSESLEPAALSMLLDEYFGPMSDLVQAEGGTLDKYIGDAVMAFWGAPLEMEDHAARACRTALAMLDALGTLNARWSARGLAEVRIGIGLNTGMMSVGNMGSEAHFAYTVIGDAVNLGSRLETLTKEYGAGILAGERVRELAGPAFVWRELDFVRVVGRDGTARVFELLGTSARGGVSAAEVARYEAALAAYREGNWDVAEAGFSEVLANRHDDRPAAVLRDRVRALRLDPPSGTWDGVYTQRSK